jgi:hypothetical protein
VAGPLLLAEISDLYLINQDHVRVKEMNITASCRRKTKLNQMNVFLSGLVKSYIKSMIVSHKTS